MYNKIMYDCFINLVEFQRKRKAGWGGGRGTHLIGLAVKLCHMYVCKFYKYILQYCTVISHAMFCPSSGFAI